MRRGLSSILAVLFSCQLCVLVFGQGRIDGASESPWHLEPRTIAPASPALGSDLSAGGEQDPEPPPLPPDPTILPEFTMPAPPKSVRPVVRGIYATGYSAGSSKKLGEILTFIGKTEVNALVVDVKDDSGTLSYVSSVPLARRIGAGRAKFSPEKLIGLLQQANVYPIARIVVFKDPILAAKRPDLAVKSKAGGLWRDRKGLCWVDPHNREVWQYVVDVAKEAAAKGFREIQFDYVRFTSDGKLSDCVYPFATGQRKADVIKDFLLFARQQLKPLGVEVSADVFGLTCSAQDDLGIGQRLEPIAAAVDIISPMVYPSHYERGTYGIQDPDLAPYETVLASLKAATSRVTGLGVRLRPWLQDFSLRNKYGRAQLMSQIKAVYDAGLTEWIFWNPGNTYNSANYNAE